MPNNLLQTVLLIDDRDADNYIHKMLIKSMDIADAVIDFTYAEDALDYLKSTDRHPVDLILLDINMPRMDGFEFLEEYQKLDQLNKSRVIVVMLTSSLASADTERAKTFSEIKDYKSKPLTITLMQELLEEHFNGKCQ